MLTANANEYYVSISSETHPEVSTCEKMISDIFANEQKAKDELKRQRKETTSVQTPLPGLGLQGLQVVPRSKKNNSRWSKEEEDQLRQIIDKCGHQSPGVWTRASAAMGFTRNETQCQWRWLNFLHPSIRRDPWTEEEDTCLLQLQGEFGNSWTEFSTCTTLVGRSPVQIMYRFHKLKRKVNICSYCNLTHNSYSG